MACWALWHILMTLSFAGMVVVASIVLFECKSSAWFILLHTWSDPLQSQCTTLAHSRAAQVVEPKLFFNMMHELLLVLWCGLPRLRAEQWSNFLAYRDSGRRHCANVHLFHGELVYVGELRLVLLCMVLEFAEPPKQIEHIGKFSLWLSPYLVDSLISCADLTSDFPHCVLCLWLV